MTYSAFVSIINTCMNILLYKFTIFGYSLTLWNVLIFCLVAFLILKFFFSMMR